MSFCRNKICRYGRCWIGDLLPFLEHEVCVFILAVRPSDDVRTSGLYFSPTATGINIIEVRTMVRHIHCRTCRRRLVKGSNEDTTHVLTVVVGESNQQARHPYIV